MHPKLRAFVLLFLLFFAPYALAESKTPDYPGVAEPFSDPAQYEFAEDEKEDKAFFHLGRFLMIGLDLGAGVFTGGIGSTTGPGFLAGGHFVFFLDRQFAFEGRIHYSDHTDMIRGAGGIGANIDYSLVAIQAGFRFYIDTLAAPRAIAIANPYIAFGGGIYLRNEVPFQTNGSLTGASFGASTSFGGYAGGGAEFLIYHKHVYLGVDIRYHMIFWPDANNTLGGLVAAGSLGGGYVGSAVTLTYCF